MSRNSSTEAIVFSVKPLGENNSSVRLFTPQGILYATLYGGPKSRLRPRVSVWNSGTAWLYTNEQNGSIKISDFDVKNYHLSFRGDLFKNFAAAIAAEIVIKTNAAGSAEKCFHLTSGFLDGLEIADASQSRSGLIRFLWRYLELLGIQPDAENCAVCGKAFADESSGAGDSFASDGDSAGADESVGASASASADKSANTSTLAGAGVSYELSENGFVCTECHEANGVVLDDRPLFLTREAVNYLASVSNMTAAQSRALHLSNNAESELKRLLFFLIEQACGTKLKTLESAGGIL